MSFKISSIGEWFTALRTIVWLLSSMSDQVSCQVLRLPEWFITLWMCRLMRLFFPFWAYRKWHFGDPNQNSETTFQYKLAPKTPKKPPQEPAFFCTLFAITIGPMSDHCLALSQQNWRTSYRDVPGHHIERWEQGPDYANGVNPGLCKWDGNNFRISPTFQNFVEISEFCQLCHKCTGL